MVFKIKRVMERIIRLSLAVIFISGIVAAQQQIEVNEIYPDKRTVHFYAADSMDYVSPVPSLLPECEVLLPGATVFIPCSGVITEAEDGIYLYVVDSTEVANEGMVILKFDDALMVPARLKVQIIPPVPLAVETGR